MTAIGQGIAPWTVTLVAETVIITEVLVLISEWYKERRYKRGFVDGVSKTQRDWEEWNRRRETATAAGLEFTESAPAPAETTVA